MGKSVMSGPVYGAKATLFSGKGDCSTGSSAVMFGTVMPRGEDWYVTDLAIYRNSTGSSALTISLHDDSTLIGSVAAGGSTIAFGNSTQFTPDSGEFEGTMILAGSTVTLSHSSHAGPNVNVCVTLSGFRRFNSTASTRTE